MGRMIVKGLGVAILMLFAALMLQGCIPPNEHVGKPPAHSYKDGYYDGYYYDHPYNGDYYYR